MKTFILLLLCTVSASTQAEIFINLSYEKNDLVIYNRNYEW